MKLVLVPAEPTEEMKRDAIDANEDTGDIGAVWSAAIAAAPPLTAEMVDELTLAFIEALARTLTHRDATIRFLSHLGCKIEARHE